MQLFYELISALNLEVVADSKSDHVSLVFDEEVFVNVELKESESRIVFSSLVGLLSEVQEHQQLRSFLALNLAIVREHAMGLGLEPETNAVVLTYSVDVRHALLSTIEEALSLFLGQTEKCQAMMRA
ncbi:MULTISPECIES: type III secretion system chaperone [unclassified Pseudomonas]|uniref:type III secretion system chaperone n=1 Tax=unclassified Pseudomonas TaxID=196821 RepID=UPI0013146766|nr:MULTISPECIES: type III secretion system chaperone [unclassified Pseudomonas]